MKSSGAVEELQQEGWTVAVRCHGGGIGQAGYRGKKIQKLLVSNNSRSLTEISLRHAMQT